MTEVRMYAPVRGPSHYIMLTPAGVRAGVSVQWWPASTGWRPSVRPLDGGGRCAGFRLSGYRQVLFTRLDPDVLPALFLNASASERSHAGNRPGEDHEELG
jgi:hypothetical protein